MNKILLIVCILLSVEALKSQTVSNIETNQTKDLINVSYTVSGIPKNQSYEVSLSYTKDNLNFSEPVKSVYGDVGKGIKGNGKKKISWDALKDVNAFDGDYAFKVTIIPNEKVMLPTASGGNFSAQINHIKLRGNTLIMDIVMVNHYKNEKYTIDVNDSRMIGKDGNEYFAVNVSTNSNSEKYTLKMNLIKDIPMKFQITFDNIPTNLYDISYFEIKSYLSPPPNISFKNLKIEH